MNDLYAINKDLTDIPDFLRREPVEHSSRRFRRLVEPKCRWKMPKQAPRKARKRKTTDQTTTLKILGWSERQYRKLTYTEAETVIRKSLTPSQWQRMRHE